MLRATRENRQKRLLLFVYGTITLYGGPSQNLRLKNSFVTFPPVSSPERLLPATPRRQRLEALTPARFWLFPFRSPLLGESRLISVPQGTKMFQFPWYSLRHIKCRIPGHYSGRVSPFGNPRICACLTTPRGLSQPTTSFIAFWHQGIRHLPLVA